MDKKFIDLLEQIDIDPIPTSDEINQFILTYFDKKVFLTKENKNARLYFQHLVPFALSTIDKKLLKKAFGLLNNIYAKLYPESSSLDSILSKQIRTPISTRFGVGSPEHVMSKKEVKLTYKKKGELIQKSKDSLLMGHKEIIRYDPENVLRIISNGIKSENPYEKAVALALSSGCRPIELFDKNIHFTKINDHWVEQNSVAKKRGKIVPVKKPIIGISPQKFIDEIDDMRWFIKDTHKTVIKRDKTLNGTIEQNSNETAKKLFDRQDNITLYSCRKVYANLSYELYAKNSIVGKDPTLQLWISAVLGHNPTDIATANHYSTFKSNSKDPQTTKVKELKVEIETLKGVITNENIPITKPTIISPKDIKKKQYLDKVAEYFNSQENDPNQTECEKALNGIVPRAFVRLWFRKETS